MKKGLFLLFWGVLCLAGCVREPQAATPAATRMVLETPDSPATTAVPPLPALIETPAATAAVATAVSAPPLALQLTPQTAVSTLPAIPLALRWRYDTADVATALDLYSLDGGPAARFVGRCSRWARGDVGSGTERILAGRIARRRACACGG
ncbi:MAG: hypothetical protein H6660_07980 [Ardenticatenaceae bacterium]|nr:hypothetical protein [Ardenticatenaceae bacterium]